MGLWQLMHVVVSLLGNPKISHFRFPPSCSLVFYLWVTVFFYQDKYQLGNIKIELETLLTKNDVSKLPVVFLTSDVSKLPVMLASLWFYFQVKNDVSKFFVER